MGSPDRTELLDTLTEGISSLTSSEQLATPPRRPGPVPPLQLRQRPPHRRPVPRGHPGGRLRHLEVPRTFGRQGGVGDLDPRPGRRPEGPGGRRRGTPTDPRVPDRAGVRPESDHRRPTPRGLQHVGRRRPDPAARSARATGPRASATRSCSPSSPAPSTVTAPSPHVGSGSRSVMLPTSRSRRSPTSSPTPSCTRQVDDRSLAELEAESTAYVVCRSLGLDSGAYSFGYVATLGRRWRAGGRRDQGVRRAHPAGGSGHPRCAPDGEDTGGAAT